ncbi:hypothetical protein JCM11491_003884 [Sporobolomyces phaffii]
MAATLPARPHLLRTCRHTLATAQRTYSTRPRPKDFYCTTPIFYVNADPHIGHLHSALLADVYTRWSRLREPDRGALMCTGTDEHGLKIQRVAEAKGVDPKALCDDVSQRFRELSEAADVDARVFIRTTEPRHRKAVEHVWTELEKRGYIYKSSYAGWYAVSDEAYYAENQVAETTDPKSGEKYMASIETGTRVEWMEEENFKFRLSAFRERLIEWLSSTPHPVQPPSRTTALLASLSHPSSTDLADLSISRPSSRLTWGIPVPSDENHTIYVWIDALVNYMTVAGYPWAEGQSKIWPPDLQVVGKDIVRFHALYLPAILMALDLPLPKHLLTHGHWTMDRFKMSKSRGNVANPFAAMRVWSTDAIRMYLMAKGGNSAADADYAEAEIERFYKKELAGQMGNLLARVTGKKMVAKLGDEALMYTAPGEFGSEDQELVGLLRDLPDAFAHHLATFEVHRALSLVFDALAAANRHIQTLSPWLSTATRAQVHRSLYLSSESLRVAGILLQPFMPTKSAVLLDALGVRPDERTWERAPFGRGGARDRVRAVKSSGGGLWPPVALPPSTPREPVTLEGWDFEVAPVMPVVRFLLATRFPRLVPFLFLVFVFALAASEVEGRTTSFSSQDTRVAYRPSDAWRHKSNATQALRQGAVFEFRFAGEQVSLFGAGESYNVAIDGDDADVQRNDDRLFIASNLDPDRPHSLRLEVRAVEANLTLTRVAVAFSSTNQHVPALLAGFDSESSFASPITSSTSHSTPTSLEPIPTTFDSSTRASKAPSGGVVVGATLGALFALSISVAFAVYAWRRFDERRSTLTQSRRPLDDPSSYVNHETGTRRGSTFLLGAAFSTGRRASSFLLPWSGSSSAPRTPLPSPSPSVQQQSHGPRSLAPAPPPASSGTVLVGSETWQAKLVRAASWRRKAERLAETRKFYGVGRTPVATAAAERRGPPPAVPLPVPPRDGTRDMEERWRGAESTLVVTMNAGPAGAIGEEATTDACSIVVSSPTSTVVPVAPSSPSRADHDDDDHGHHLRRRSHPDAGGAPLSSPKAAGSYRNPFSHARTLTNTTTRPSLETTAAAEDDDDESSRSSSIEHARISLAHTRTVRAGGRPAIDDAAALLVRSSSMRSIFEHADPTSTVLGVQTVRVERKPSLTRIVNGRVAAVGERTRHESVAGVIEPGTPPRARRPSRAGQGEENGTRRTRRAEPELPSEEDRPDYWVKRETIPRYTQAAGDPRR